MQLPQAPVSHMSQTKWNLSNRDAIGAEESVLLSGVKFHCMQSVLGERLDRCPHFRGVLPLLQRRLCTHLAHGQFDLEFNGRVTMLKQYIGSRKGLS